MSSRTLTDADFDRMSWHDNHVHGLRIVGAEVADHLVLKSGELVLDLDHIVEWVEHPDRGYRFRIQPSTLRFLEVSELRIVIDYSGRSQLLYPFSIHGIECAVVQRERYKARLWTIRLSFPEGAITFEAHGFEQTGWGKIVDSTEQCLLPSERVPLESRDV
jgi:hypothetical protein